MMTHRFFCYGTLKQGFSSHDLLTRHDAKFLGEARTNSNYHMHNLGWFPGVIFNDEVEGGVVGELYEINDKCLKDLDIYEGHPTLFRRQKIELEDGTQAIAYIYNQPVRFYSKIDDGHWLQEYADTFADS